MSERVLDADDVFEAFSQRSELASLLQRDLAFQQLLESDDGGSGELLLMGLSLVKVAEMSQIVVGREGASATGGAISGKPGGSETMLCVGAPPGSFLATLPTRQAVRPALVPRMTPRCREEGLGARRHR